MVTGSKKVSVGVSAECTHRDPQTGTARINSLLCRGKPEDQLNCLFDFFDSILLIPQWVKLVEPYEVRLYINLGVPDKAMFT